MIRSWDIVMKPFSKRRQSAILNFRKLLFSSRGVCLSMVLLVHTKYHVNQTWRYSQNTIFNMAAVRHFEFHEFFINKQLSMWLSLPKFESAHQISLKSDDPRLRYSGEIIFKMAAVRHLEFSKIVNLVTWPMPEHDCASMYQISR